MVVMIIILLRGGEIMNTTLKFKDVNLIQEALKELTKLLKIRQVEILDGDDHLTLYQKGKIDGLNIAIKEMAKVINMK